MNRRSVPSTFMIPMFEDLVSPFTTAWAKAIDRPSGENAGVCDLLLIPAVVIVHSEPDSTVSIPVEKYVKS